MQTPDATTLQKPDREGGHRLGYLPAHRKPTWIPGRIPDRPAMHSRYIAVLNTLPAPGGANPPRGTPQKAAPWALGGGSNQPCIEDRSIMKGFGRPDI